MYQLTQRQRLLLLRAQLESERSTFLATWREVGENIYPRRQRYVTTDANLGNRRNQTIINSAATLAARTLRSGMMGGVTSPARPWFRLATPDPSLSDYGPVKEWLYIVGERMAATFLRSNIYNILPITYGDIGVFGTAAMSVEEDFQGGIRSMSFPIGSYKIANDSRLKVSVFQRDFRMTVRQLVEKYGVYDAKTGAPRWDNFSPFVKSQYDQSRYETWVDVCHTIEPNRDFDVNKFDSKNKKFRSTTFEIGNSGSASNYIPTDAMEIYLADKGFDHFPILCPRWEVTGEDAYGTSCPAIDAIGDIKALQLMEKRKAQAVEKMVNPPMTGPTSLRNAKTSILPGDVTYADAQNGNQGFRPAHEVRFSVNEVAQDIQRYEQRISRAFYEDLFLMLSESDRRQITATEIDERKEEKLLALGPVLEQLNQDLLDPLIDITFDIMNRQGQIPMPPKELHGVKLRVEYISIMAQAQKLIGIESLERFANFSSNVVARDPNAADKIDTDHMIQVYGEMTSIAPGIVRSDDEVQALRQQKAQAQAQQQKMQQMEQAASTAQQLSQTDMSGDTALNRLLQTAKAGNLAPEQ